MQLIGHRLYEINELMDIFGPAWTVLLYELTLFFSMVTTLW